MPSVFFEGILEDFRGGGPPPPPPRPPKRSILISVNHKYIVKVRPAVTAKTGNMYDHMERTQGNFQPNVYISHVVINYLPTDMTP